MLPRRRRLVSGGEEGRRRGLCWLGAAAGGRSGGGGSNEGGQAGARVGIWQGREEATTRLRRFYATFSLSQAFRFIISIINNEVLYLRGIPWIWSSGCLTRLAAKGTSSNSKASRLLSLFGHFQCRHSL
jgi:hypothetical protein